MFTGRYRGGTQAEKTINGVIMISYGCNLMNSKTKIDQSTLMMDLSIATATGGVFMGERRPRDDVFHLTHQNDHWIRKTMRRLCDIRSVPIPSNLTVETMWDYRHATYDDLIASMEGVLKDRPSLKLIVIDELAVIAGGKKSKESENAFHRRRVNRLIDVCSRFQHLRMVVVRRHRHWKIVNFTVEGANSFMVTHANGLWDITKTTAA